MSWDMVRISLNFKPILAKIRWEQNFPARLDYLA